MTINVSTLLDVALSLVFIFFTFSLFVSGIVEFINTWSNQRSRLLKLALIKALDQKKIDKTLRQMAGNIDSKWDTVAPIFARFWDHPLVRVKRQIDDRPWVGDKPISYLNAESFSTVILDLLASATPETVSMRDTDEKRATRLMMARIRETVANAKTGPAAVDFTALASLVGPLLEKSDTLMDLKTALEHWYDGYMEQVSGWFKRNTQAVVWGISILITIAMNVDTLRITRQLFMDPELRDSLVQRAADVAAQKPQSTTAGSTSATPKAFIDYLETHDATLASSLTAVQATGKPLSAEDSLAVQSNRLRYLQTTIVDLGLPIGWPIKTKGVLELFFLLLGWALTATALSFGAPFWFDLLVKLVNIRNVAKKPASSVVPDK